MDINLVIRQLRDNCPVFNGRVSGAAAAADWQLFLESTTLPCPAAFVIPMGDHPGERMALNMLRQPLNDIYAVVVVLDNTLDEPGKHTAQDYEAIRKALWGALLGWQPATPDYNGTVYEGSFLLGYNRARSCYQFEFSAYMEIAEADTWQYQYLQSLPHFDGLDINVDVIDPIADPLPGPDGRIEFTVSVPNLAE